ncbi:MAG: membrane protein insertion efficiency factor YidD [Spirochaetales bacterium]|nr:membrane protein insertion efficiency factor YidD [Spirochaetales bacterium]|tara:strand:- start:1951 stop:2187 length:237 start_codon:yes stop_codon:yes gene_type:complete
MKKLTQLILIVLIKIYRISLSRILPQSCRYHPSCSQYALEAITLHGPLKGLKFALIRLLKCNPFFEGGKDEVPARGRS